MLANINVELLPTKESLRTRVNLLPLNGRCFLSMSIALMHSLRAKRLLLISEPSFLVYFEESLMSAPLSLPAKSIKENFDKTRFFLFFRLICSIPWDQDESLFIPV